MTTLGQWGSVDIGAVTGANSFFVLDAETAEKLPAKLLWPAVSKAHQIPGAVFAQRDYLALRQNGGKVQMLVAEAKTDPRLLSEIEATSVVANASASTDATSAGFEIPGGRSHCPPMERPTCF